MQILTDQGSNSQPGKAYDRVVQMFEDIEHSNYFVSTLTLSIVTELAAKQIFLDLNK